MSQFAQQIAIVKNISDKPGMKKQEKRWRTPPTLWEKIKPLARGLRHKQTGAEELLWQRLRRNQLNGFGFRRQHSIGQFIVDFFCPEVRLVIEVDGTIHQYQKEKDAIKQEYLESLGLKVLHFSNDVVIQNLDEVIAQIKTCLPELI